MRVNGLIECDGFPAVETLQLGEQVGALHLVAAQFPLRGRKAQPGFVDLQPVGVAVGQLAVVEIGHGLRVGQPLFQLGFERVVIDQLDARLLGFEQDGHAPGTVLDIEQSVLRIGHAAARTGDGGDVETLRDPEILAVADGRRVAPEVVERNLGIGQRDAGLVLQFVGLGLFAQGFERRVVALDLLQYGIDRLLCRHGPGQSQYGDQYDVLFHGHSSINTVFADALPGVSGPFRLVSMYMVGMMKPFRSVEVSSPPSITFAIGLWTRCQGQFCRPKPAESKRVPK